MKVHPLVLGVSLLASWGIADETVLLSDGSRMQVRSVEIRGNVAVIETLSCSRKCTERDIP